MIFPIALISYQLGFLLISLICTCLKKISLSLNPCSLGSTLGITSSGAIAGDGGVKISSPGKNDKDQIQLLMVDRSRALVGLQIYSPGDSMFEESRGDFTRCQSILKLCWHKYLLLSISQMFLDFQIQYLSLMNGEIFFHDSEKRKKTI